MDALQILESPDYINANSATKRAIFDKHIASMPDYTNANEATQSAIRQRFGIADAKRSYALSDIPGAAVKNAPADVAKIAGDIYGLGKSLVTEPVKTTGAIAGGLADVAAGSLRAGAKKVLPTGVFEFLDSIDKPEVTDRISTTANRLGGYLAENYGSYDAIKRSVAERPVSTLADLSTLATGGGIATARAAPAVSNVLMKTAAATDPLSLAITGGAASVNALRSAASRIPPPLETARGALEPLVAPQAVAVNRLAAVEDPQVIVNALRQTQGMQVTPGAPAPSLSERMIAAGVPSLAVAGLETGLASASPQAAQQVASMQFQRLSAIQGQLARVENQIQTQAAALAPADLSQLRQVRDTLMRELADEQQMLSNTAAGVAQPLPSVSQREVGGQIQQRGAQTAETFRKETIKPAFRAAFEADAPTPSINLAGPLQSAQRLVDDIGTLVDPSTVSPAVRNLLKIEPYDPKAKVAPVVSLEDFQSIRSALREQERAAANVDLKRASALNSVVRQMDDALKTSGVPVEARELLKKAQTLVREEQVPRFRTGATGKMLSTTRFNMPGTLPSQQVASFLKNEEAAAQFVRTFGSDPRALQSMQQGVLDLYRRDIVDPATKAVDPKKAAAFEQKYAGQLDTLEAAGLNVRETMGQVRQDAAAVEQAMGALAAEASKFGKAKSAQAVVDLALKSPMDMRFVRDRLTPQARTALSDELVGRATTLIQNGDAAGALAYLTKNERALKVGLGKEAPQTYNDLLGTARLQEQLIKLSAQVPKSDVVTPVRLAQEFTPQELTNLQVVADDLRRMRQVEQLGTPPDVAARRMASEQAAEIGTRAADAPALFMPIYTAAKNAVKRLEERVNRKAVAAAIDLMIRDPDRLIPLLEQAAATKKAPRPEPRPLTIPSARITGVAPAAVAGREENQNAMAR